MTVDHDPFHTDVEQDYDEEDEDEELPELAGGPEEPEAGPGFRWGDWAVLAHTQVDTLANRLAAIEKYVKDENERGQDEEIDGYEGRCTCCISNKARHRLLPCRHTSFCLFCAVQFMRNFRRGQRFLPPLTGITCPECRTDIEEMTPVTD